MEQVFQKHGWSIEAAQLTAPQIHQASDVLARAFADDPGTSYLLPDPERRARLLGTLFSSVLLVSATYCRIYITSGPLSGVAIWAPPEHPIPPVSIRNRMRVVGLMTRLGWSGFRRVWRQNSYTNRLHMQAVQGPHWHLMLLGVEPDCQGCGLGSALLEQGLAEAESGGFACYLETATMANVQFYQRHGFKLLTAGAVPGGGPPCWTMLRAPASLPL